MLLQSTDKAIMNLLEWSEREEWASYSQEVYAFHVEPFCDGPSDDPFAGINGDSLAMLNVFIMEDFFSTWFGDEERNVIDDFLKRRGWRETPAARRYLEALRDSMPSIYEVVDVVPGQSVAVRDLIRDGAAVTVAEVSGSEVMALWDCMAARVVEVDRTHHFTGAILHFRREVAREMPLLFREMAAEIEEDMRQEAKERGEESLLTRDIALELALRFYPVAQMFTQVWLTSLIGEASAPLPELRNSDGEDMVFCNVRFPVSGDRMRVVSLLDGEDTLERDGDDAAWTWIGAGSPLRRAARHRQAARTTEIPDEMFDTTALGHAELREGMLVLSVNSVERAERARTFLASLLGELVGPALIVQQDPHVALKEYRGAEEPDKPEIPTEEAERIMHAYIDAHYRHTLDDSIPMLDDRTPREAAATRNGRSQVIEWLKGVENAESRRASDQGQRPYDTAWMWQELGIENPR